MAKETKISNAHSSEEREKRSEPSGQDHRPEQPKYHIGASNAQVGVIGDGARIDGGVHFHYPGSIGRTTLASAVSPAAVNRQQREENSSLMQILHLSDLHFGKEKTAERWYSPLANDLIQDLQCDRLDAILISGDVANFSEEAEYAEAKIFIEKICKEFSVDRINLVIVPGNHDLNWKLSKRGYTLTYKDHLQEDPKEGEYIPINEEVVGIKQAEQYQKRFAPFSRFYEAVTGGAYPLDENEQGIIYHLKDHQLLILGLNSAWQVDHRFKARASINADALALALNQIRQTPDYAKCLKLAVWHHPLNSPFEDRITDHGFMERLAQSGFRVCLHGHMHKASNELFRYDRSPGGRKIEIVGAGTFGAPVREWTPGYPLQYNLLRIYPKQIVVETRRREEINGVWKPDARWTQGQGQDPSFRYRIDLVPELKKKSR